MRIVAFGHRRYVGKDTAADFLISYLRLNKRGLLIRKIGFASKMKAITHDLYAWAGLQDEAYYEEHPELKAVVIPALGKAPREIWIEYGMACREIYRGTWLQYPLKAVRADFLILKDLRFPDEAEEILAQGGMCYRIDNPRIEKFNDRADVALADWPGWTGVLVNDTDLATFNRLIISTIGEKL